ncbi:DUF1328 domain-containing protein [Brevundimonas staleyi]|uniref:UPF0391 membrane protein ACFPIE_12720 n=1 Tax=Brevundimonas staleyi TaxID=74326 RepID=A0ABW0FST2_9CAUL
MIRWAIIFFVVALIAAALGFTTVFGAAMDIAKFIAVIAIILFVISLVAGGLRGRGGRI